MLKFARAGLSFQDIPEEYRESTPLPAEIPVKGAYFPFFFLSFFPLSLFMRENKIEIERCGKLDWDIFHSMTIIDELSRISVGVCSGLGGTSVIGAPPIVKHGTEEQKRKWLPGILTGEVRHCLGATEPTGERSIINRTNNVFGSS